LGLLGLGLVVIVHELGHLVAAKASGVEVEIFSVGWGPRIASFTRGKTEWRISAFPIGGFCKMKGEDAFRKALEDKASAIPRDSGSFYGTSPWRRIAIALSGPFANLVFAIIVFTLVFAIGYTVPTTSNRIVLASEYSLDASAKKGSYPADAAGLKSGDRIVSADGKPIVDYSDIQEFVALNADRPVRLGIERGGILLSITITPAMDRETGAGRIGIFSWIEPEVESVVAGGAAAIAGVEAGDRIIAVDGTPIPHAIAALALLASKPERAVFSLDRGGRRIEALLVLSWNDSGASNLGIGFKTQPKTIKATSFGSSIASGLAETWKTFSVSIKGLGLLFKGVDLFKAVSGPARITYMVGKSATEGFQSAGSGGIALPFNFLAFLSIGLFIMNLLPIPALDGGLIAIALLELLRRKPLKPLTVYRYQFVGSAMILAIFVFATIGDVLFFAAH
jgi:regulator of sigma E protease